MTYTWTTSVTVIGVTAKSYNTVGMCTVEAAGCNATKTTVLESGSDWACEECATDNCNPETKPKGSSGVASSAVRMAEVVGATFFVTILIVAGFMT